MAPLWPDRARFHVCGTRSGPCGVPVAAPGADAGRREASRGLYLVPTRALAPEAESRLSRSLKATSAQGGGRGHGPLRRYRLGAKRRMAGRQSHCPCLHTGEGRGPCSLFGTQVVERIGARKGDSPRAPLASQSGFRERARYFAHCGSPTRGFKPAAFPQIGEPGQHCRNPTNASLSRRVRVPASTTSSVNERALPRISSRLEAVSPAAAPRRS
jgi:hypothetical protein